MKCGRLLAIFQIPNQTQKITQQEDGNVIENEQEVTDFFNDFL
jgi:hypothetical protein